ncbi:3,4-dihydroxy-2-butanone-4-phosphate synthase [Candidatus Woesearchaeota archaeon]|nr:3,4-dihydroxy-2-butanone-4-phosphate synthase [Candidatus Woesearchaeota archaeon]
MSVDDAIRSLRNGRFVIILDDEQRENEGDLVLAAEKVTEEKLNQMLKIARGILCVPVDAKRLDELKIPLMVANPTDKFATPFTVSIDHHSTSTGVSVKDRVKSIRALLNPNSKAGDFLRPGHIFPLRAHGQGLFGRRGHTEAAIALMGLASLYPAALIAEIMDDNGRMAKRTQLNALAKSNGIGIVTINEIYGQVKKKV